MKIIQKILLGFFIGVMAVIISGCGSSSVSGDTEYADSPIAVVDRLIMIADDGGRIAPKDTNISLIVYAIYADGSDPEDVTEKASWESNNSNVSVDDGIVYSSTAQIAEITASYGDKSASRKVVFTDANFNYLEIQEGYREDGQGIVVTGNTIGLQIVDDVSYDPVSLGAYYPTLWAVYDDGTKHYANQEAFWWSSDQIRAYVNTIQGSFVFGRGIGSGIEITARYMGDESSFFVDVTAPINKDLLVIGIKNTKTDGWGCDQNDAVYNNPATFSLSDSRKKYLQACGKFHYPDGTEQWEDINNNVAWLSTDRNIAFMRTYNGRLIVVQEGTVTISAKVAGKVGEINVTVIQ